MISSEFLESNDISNLVDLLRRRAEAQPDIVAYIFLVDGENEEVKLTYGELDEQARAIAAELRKNYEPGERALLIYPPGLEFISAFFGCLYAGVIAVPCYPPDPNKLDVSIAKLQGIIADCVPEVLLTTKELLDLAAFIFPDYPDLEKLNWLPSDKIEAGLANDWKKPEIDGDTLAFLQYTSGSTGDPKGVMVSHGNILSNEKIIANVADSSEQTIGLGWLPVFHDMGLIGLVIQPLYMGFVSVLMSPIDFLKKPVRWLQAMSKYKAVVSAAPNFAYDQCVNKISSEELATLDLSHWDHVFNGAEPIRVDTLNRFVETFKPCGFKPETFYPCYGLAEATLIVSGGLKRDVPVIKYVDKKDLKQNKVTYLKAEQKDALAMIGCGSAFPEHEIAIVDPETSTMLSDSQVGEIWLSGPSVARGYWNKPELTAETFQARLPDADQGPFLRSGDLGFMKDGELFVTGRLKDMIIIRGMNHYPQDIELTAEQSHEFLRPGCAAAFSVEVEDEERLVLVQEIKPKTLEDADAKEAIQNIRASVTERHGLGLYSIALIEPRSIPKTSSGKIRRTACKQKFLDGNLDVISEWKADLPARAVATPDRTKDSVPSSTTYETQDIQNWIAEIVAQESGISVQNINIEDSFYSYGLDSVQAVSIAGQLEKRLGKEVSPTLIYNYPNIREFARYLSGEYNSVETADEPTQTRNPGDPIAIIGMGCRFPGADSPDEFWKALKNGVDAIGEVPSEIWDIDEFYDSELKPGKMNTRWGGFLSRAQIETFDAGFFGISPLEAKSMDPQQRMLLEVSWEALENAGLVPDEIRGSKSGVFIGICSNDYSRLRPDSSDIDIYFAAGNALSISANRLSYALDLRGPSVSIDTACSSSLVSTNQACRSLALGECDLALAGGVNVILDPNTNIAFSQAGILAPDGRAKTFDAKADGYARSEGCGVIVLKRLSDARADGDNILAVIKGSAVNQDGRSNGLTAPNGNSQQEVILEALKNADVRPSQISYVETHGSATPLGDPIEVESLKTVLTKGREEDELCWLGAVKSNIGHLEGAAGVAGLIKTVLCLNNKTIPPNINFQELNPLIHIKNSPLQIPRESTEWRSKNGPLLAGVSSFGFGGTNAHVILEEAPEAEQPASEAADESREGLLVISAKTEKALADLAAKYIEFLQTRVDIPLDDICFTAAVKRNAFDHRLAVAGSRGKIIARLRAFIEGDKSLVATGKARDDKEIAFMFTGQGSQYLKMGKEIYERSPVFKKAMDQCAEILEPLLDESLLEVLFSEDENQDDFAFNDSVYAQPALFALEYALTELWKSWGVTPKAMIGHSIGEYVAACLSGVLSLKDALTLVVTRSRLAKKLAPEGRMLTVLLSKEELSPIIKDNDQLFLSATNGSLFSVVSGRTKSVKKLCSRLLEEGVASLYLNISRPFHCPMMNKASEALNREAKSVKLNRPLIPYISNLTGSWITEVQAADTNYWGEHLCRMVNFDRGAGELLKNPDRILLEVGPDQTLGLLLEMFPEKTNDQLVLSSMNNPKDKQSKIPEPEFLLSAVGGLWVAGVDIDWPGFYADAEYSGVALPNYPWQREKRWLSTSGYEISARDIVHPLIGKQLSLAAYQSSSVCFESQLNSSSPEYLGDYRVFQTAVMPVSAFIEMALAAGAIHFENDRLSIQDIFVGRALLFPENKTRKLQTFIAKADPDDEEYKFEIFSASPGGQYDEPPWEFLASGTIGQKGASSGVARMDLEKQRSLCDQEISAEQLYNKLEANGLNYGPLFKTVKRVYTSGQGEALGELELPDDLISDFNEYRLHPALLEGGWQTAAISLNVETDETYAPIGIGSVEIYQSPDTRMWCRVKSSPDNKAGLDILKIEEITLFKSDGELVAEIKDFTVKKVSPAQILPKPESDEEALKSWYHGIKWKPAPRAETSSTNNDPETWLLFIDPAGIGRKLADLLTQRGDICFLALQGKAYEQINEREFIVNPRNPRDFDLLFEVLAKTAEKANNHPVKSIAYLWSVEEKKVEDEKEMSSEYITHATDTSCLGGLYLIQALLKAGLSGRPDLWFVTQNAQPVAGTSPSVSQAPIWGMGRAINMEYPGLLSGMIDLDCGEPEPLAAKLFDELQNPDVEDHIALRNEKRYAARLERIKVPNITETISFDPDASYLITGGLGGLGIEMARWMADRGARHLALTSRRGLSDNNEKAKEAVSKMREAGVEVTTLQADISDDEATLEMMKTVKTSLPPLKGIIHSAGLIDDAILEQISEERFSNVAAPKIRGTWNLHLMTLDAPLDFFICFSSMASMMGSPGQTNYSAANAFMDGFAHYRRSRGLPATSVNWAPWKEAGINKSLSSVNQARISRLTKPIATKQGLRAMEQVLSTDLPQIGVMSLNWENYLKEFPSDIIPPLFSEQTKSLKIGRRKSSDILRKLKEASADERQDILTRYLQIEAAGILGLKTSQLPDPRQNFFQLGMDSLMAMRLKSRIEFDLECSLSAALIMRFPSVSQISKIIKDIKQGSFIDESEANIDLNAEAVLDSEITVKSSATETESALNKEPEKIFLTGATGFLGGHLLYELLEGTQADIYSLIRAKTEEEGGQRLRRHLENYSLFNQDHAHRIIPVIGDLSGNLLGLSEERFESLAEEIDVIYHNGALVNFSYPYSMLRTPNILGTQDIIKLACARKTKPLHYISTVGVFELSSAYSDNPQVAEDDYVDCAYGFNNGYAQSKWVAEKLVLQARERGLPAAIYRPARITGHSETGLCNLSDLFSRLVKGSIQLGLAPIFHKEVIDFITPVDYVSKAIFHLSRQKEAFQKSAFHLSNPEGISFADIVQWIKNIGYSIEYVSYKEWRESLLNTEKNALYPLSELFTPTLFDELRTLEIGCENTLEGLKGSGISCPAVSELFDVYYSYFTNSGFLERPKELS